MRYFFFAIFSFGLLLGSTSCNKHAGCPGVRAYTQSSQAKSKKKGNAPWGKKSGASASKKGNEPWKKKTQKKDDKKATSGLFSPKVKKDSDQVKD